MTPRRRFCGLRVGPLPERRLRRCRPVSTRLFRLLLLRRLRLPLPPSAHVCQCGRQLDTFGHHRAACAQEELLSRRGFAVELAAAKICREVGARVTANVMVRDLDLAIPQQALDGRRLEVVADGLPLFGGVQLAIDTTLVSPVRADGNARRGAAQHDGVSLATARRRKGRTFPELVGPRSRARLVILACEVVTRDFEFLVFACNSQGKARTPDPSEASWSALGGPDGQRS